MAAKYGLSSVIEYILSRGGDISRILTHGGYNALHYFSLSPSHYQSRETLELLLRSGIDIETTDALGHTPILLAVQNSSKKVVELLLQHNANLTASNHIGQTALHLYIRRLDLDLNMLRMLLENNCDPNKPSPNNNFTPLHYLATRESVENLPAILDVLIEYGINLDFQTQAGNTALHIAARHSKRLDFILHLIGRRANYGIVNDSNHTFLDILIAKHLPTALELVRVLCSESASGSFLFTDSLNDAVNSNEEVLSYFENCKEELDHLIQTPLYQSSTLNLFGFLSEDVTKISVWCRKEEVRRARSLLNLDDMPLYGLSIMQKFDKGLALYEKQCSTIAALTKVCGNILSSNSISDVVNKINPENIEVARDNLLFVGRQSNG